MSQPAKTQPLRPYTTLEARQYAASKRKTRQGWMVDCITCRKRIPMVGANCIAFGLFECPSCRSLPMVDKLPYST